MRLPQRHRSASVPAASREDCQILSDRAPMSDRLRGLSASLFVLIAVCALVSGTVAGSELTSARSDEPEALAAPEGDVPRTVDDVDRNLSSGATYWQGQTAAFVDPNGTLEADRLYLREYDEETDGPGALVREVAVNDAVRIDTAGLRGTYVFVLPDRRTTAVTVENGTVTGTTDVGEAEPFEVFVQTLDVRWRGSAGSSGTVGTDLDLVTRSNRARYNVNVTVPDRTFDDLESAFFGDRLLADHNAPYADRPPVIGRADGHDTYADADVIVLRGFDDGSLRSDLGEAESIPRSVTVEVSDTGVTDTAEISAPDVETGPFDITAVVAPASAEPGSTVELSATVQNRWGATSQRDVTFALDDDARTAVSMTLRDGESTTISTTVSVPGDPGEYEYTVDTDGDSANGTITVSDPSPNDSGGDMNESAGSDDKPATDEGDDDDGSDDAGSDGSESDGGPISVDIDFRLGVGALLTLASGAGFVVWRRR